MKNKGIIIVLFMSIAVMFTSCLTVEKKEYTFEFTGKNSGTLTIKYYNIMSTTDYFSEEEGEETGNQAEADFEELIFTYINGDKIENDYPLATNFRKRLFEENGVLCGEVKMDFQNIDAARLYQYNKKSPIMFSISSTFDGETYVSSNGTLGNEEYMNVVFWKPKTKKMNVTTLISNFDEPTESLLPYYIMWK